jgi:hypothetical protein
MTLDMGQVYLTYLVREILPDTGNSVSRLAFPCAIAAVGSGNSSTVRAAVR